ncbi:GDSL-like Lipase/Acylhydrolase [Rhodobacteraceae bacterium THAF1]|uniref:SGNH/GDSL hydrolase family protein n=1 Tax=Palleronia sp. THAF1 TaxID=2587842 RepID=UPI000F3B9757|nr:SGNH/GDSL hydrolase family protein [Palleronia sp. THAF1]QFU10065.1 GDSL-like Lipase/Acylhydrolase [Palleronia sp. THAF1]VDC17030.1 GDSL-like Lipase/Acylhydrolase [Rhodobacteraceae bacterium THAF1]
MIRLFCVLMLCAGMARGDILVMGDSVLAWNGSQSVGDVVAARTGQRVVKGARSGARIVQPNPLLRAAGLEIPRQYKRGSWDWVILNGGANDLSGSCRCARCDAELNTLLTSDGRNGAIAQIVGQLRAMGAKVLIVGYYGPSGRGGGMDACREELAELDARAGRLAARDPGVRFVETGQVMTDPSLYDPDNVHPSPSGSAAIGALIVDALR